MAEDEDERIFVKHRITDLRSIDDEEFLNRIAARGHKNISILQVAADEWTGIVEYRVLLNQFSLQLKVMHLLHNAPQIRQECMVLGQGGYGIVRYSEWNGSYIAIKRQYFFGKGDFCSHLQFVDRVSQQTFKRHSYSNQFRRYMIELSIAKLCSAFKIGSAIITDLGVDAVCYQDCFQFFQEHCKVVTTLHPKYYKRFEEQIQKCVKVLHKELKIAHCDLKPQNMMYSPTYQKFVLIDFGSCELVSESFTVMTTFRGTRGYCSEEMKRLYPNFEKKLIWGEVDLENHDKVGLRKAFEMINIDQAEGDSDLSVVQQPSRENFNEVNLLNLVHLLSGHRSWEYAQQLFQKVEIPIILAYGIENNLLKKAVVWVVARLRQLKLQFFLKESGNTNSASDSDFDIEGYRWHFQYIVTLRFEGFSRTANKLIQRLQKYPQLGHLIPKVKNEQMEAANRIFEQDLSLISFTSTNKLQLKGGYLYSSLSRDLSDIEQTEHNLRLALQPCQVIRLYHLLLLKFNSQCDCSDRLATIGQLQRLELSTTSQRLLVRLLSLVYRFDFDYKAEQLRLLEQHIIGMRSADDRDDDYFCVALQEVAKIYEMVGNCEQAQTHLNQSIGICMADGKNQYRSLLEVRYFRLAELKLSQGCYHQAKSLYDKIVEINRRLSRPARLCVVMLKSKLSFDEKEGTEELLDSTNDVEKQLRDNFSDDHPYLLRLKAVAMLRKPMPTEQKQSVLQSLMAKFLGKLGLPSEDEYVYYREQTKPSYILVRNNEVFRLLTFSLIEVYIQKCEYKRAEQCLRRLISVECGLQLQYYIPLTKLKIDTMDYESAELYLIVCKQLLQTEKYPKDSLYHARVGLLEARWKLADSDQLELESAKQLILGILQPDNNFSRNELLEARILLAHIYSLQNHHDVALNYLQQAQECEQFRDKPRARVLAELELQIVDLYLKWNRPYQSTLIHLERAKDKLVEQYGQKQLFRFRRIFFLEAKCLYYYVVDLKEAKQKAIQSLRLFTIRALSQPDILASCFLLSKIEQTLLLYPSSLKYAYRAAELSLRLYKPNHSIVGQSFLRLIQTYNSMKKHCTCDRKPLIDAYLRFFEQVQPHLLGVSTSVSQKDSPEEFNQTLQSHIDYAFQKFKTFMSSTSKLIVLDRQDDMLQLIVLFKKILKMLTRNRLLIRDNRFVLSPLQMECLFRLHIYSFMLDSNYAYEKESNYRTMFMKGVPELHRDMTNELLDEIERLAILVEMSQN